MTTITEASRADAVEVQPAPAPLAAARAAFTASFMALVLIGIGVLAARDAAVAAGWLRGEPLIPWAFDAVAEFGPQPWMAPAGVVLALVGITLIVVALLPRRPVAVALNAGTAVYIGRNDVARIASTAALDVPGVLAATSAASPRRVTVRCRVTGDRDDARALVADAVTTALEPLRHAPRIAVRIRQEVRS